MAVYRFDLRIAAPPETVYELWIDPDRLHEWVRGVTKVTGITGPPDQVGTRFTVWFGRMGSPTEVLEAQRPRLYQTRFGNAILRGESRVVLESDGQGTRLTQELRTEGLLSALTARVFATGSYKGSFRGELAAFARVAEREAAQAGKPSAT